MSRVLYTLVNIADNERRYGLMEENFPFDLDLVHYLKDVFEKHKTLETIPFRIVFRRLVGEGSICYDFTPSFKFNKFNVSMFEKIYDLLVFLTTHYSQMPSSFQKSFPEALLIEVRQFVFDGINNHSFDDHED